MKDYLKEDERKVYLVTGGSRGIGRAICEKLAGQESIILINYRNNDEAAEETLKHIKDKGGYGELFKCDVSDYNAVKDMIKRIIIKYKKIDGLVNNAGVLLMRYFMFTSREDWDNIINTNLNSVFNCVKCTLPEMIRREQGRIINISSVSTHKVIEGCVAYTVSKYAVNGLTKSLAKEVMKYNIIINGISCGFIDTDMIKDCPGYGIDLKKTGKPEDIAEWVKFFLSDNCRFVSGEIISVDNGFSL
ncbi:MAG: 3-oxoacyl-(acyl-carrier-protein) reductase FabG [Firmicutes bacterium ADurb.Bin419]|nr:MAG: 3-oxoacyl-(acyl-carrier-protein) reductase FabG [Firmicutes bacterium ADurb.Bin419]